MPEVIINNQESKSLNLSIFVSINGISFFTYNPVNFKASRIYRSTFSRPQKVENLHSLIYDEFIHNNIPWKIGVSISNTDSFEQVSFVNGISTSKGGKHVDYILNQITKKMVTYIEKKKKINL